MGYDIKKSSVDSEKLNRPSCWDFSSEVPVPVVTSPCVFWLMVSHGLSGWKGAPPTSQTFSLRESFRGSLCQANFTSPSQDVNTSSTGISYRKTHLKASNQRNRIQSQSSTGI